MSRIEPLLERILALDASDLYLTVGSPPVFRVEGVAVPANQPALSEADTVALADEAMSDPSQREEFARVKEMNLALALDVRGRFRCNIFRQRNAVGLVIRQIKLNVPTIE
jgi:twitching motility protein PilU